MRAGLRTAAIMVTAVCAGLAAAPALATPDTSGAGDVGGFRNVLPPGSRGLAAAADLGPFFADGTVPMHWADQQPLYEALVRASPSLTDRQLPRYFKDASFGVAPDDVESRISPRPGMTILRDKAYGVPHIYGDTRRDTMFGAGYAGAADRLFLMDMLRHTGRAELSSFLGGGSLASDDQQWRSAPYTDADLRRQIRLFRTTHGRQGRLAVRDLRQYSAGVNAYIAAARRDSALMPVEYSLIGRQVRDWRPTDVIATASLIGGIFGRGGGGEVRSALALRALQQRFGRQEGRLVWQVFRSRDDPQAPTTAPGRFPYGNRDPFSRRGLALPAAGSVEPAAVITERSGGEVGEASTGSGNLGSDWGAWVREALRGATSSNWELVAKEHSTTGRPIAVMGPQVGYFLPQILMEMDLHGPGIDARGVAFAGVNMYVQMGRGRDYAWSATSAGSDNVDVFAEVLCGGSRLRYRYQGRCRPMEQLTRRVAWRPNAADGTAAGSAGLTAYRTVHGIVQSYGRVRGKGVAFATARSTYMHEADSVLGFAALNDPRLTTGPKQFQRAASLITFTFNWAYADADHIAYYLSGAYPRDAPGTSPDLPVLGTGAYDWRGFRPATQTARMLPAARHPQAVDPPHLVSWNNKPARGWSAADDQWGYGPLYRSDLISARIRSGLRGGGRIGPADLVRSMSEPATQDLRGVAVLPRLLRVVGRPADPALREAAATLRSWLRTGAHRRDLDDDGAYDDERAVQIMDAWWPRLVDAQFRSGLGRDAFDAIAAIIGVGAHTGRSPNAPGFADGWWGYVARDLGELLRPGSAPGTYPRVFCGRGILARCRSDLRESLQAAVAVRPEALYGFGSCAADPRPSCYDANRSRVTGAINVPGVSPFQNRPTFQQVVSVGQRFR